MTNAASYGRFAIPVRRLMDRARRRPSMLRGLALIVLLATFGMGPAQAKNQGAAPILSPAAVAPNAVQPSTRDLQDLVNSLQNPAQRRALIDKIQALIAVRQGAVQPPAGAAVAKAPVTQVAKAPSTQGTQAAATSALPPAAKTGPGEGLIGILSGGAGDAGKAIIAMATAAPVGHFSEWAHEIATDPSLQLSMAKGAALVILVLAIAFAARRGASFAVDRLRRRLFQTARGPIWIKLAKIIGLVLLGWLPILVFIAAGYAALSIGASLPGSPVPARALALDLLDAIALAHAVSVFAGSVLQPAADGTRFVELGEETAGYWIVWISRLSRLLIYVGFAIEFARQIGMPQAQYEIVLKLLGAAFIGLLVMLILQNRAAVARVIRGHRPVPGAFDRLRAQGAEIWHVLAILYLLGVYGVWVAGIPGSFGFLIRASILTVVILAAARGLVVAGVALLGRFLAISPGLAARVPGLQARANLYAPIIIAAGRTLLYLIALLLILQAWGLGAFTLLATPFGQRVMGSSTATVIALVIAVTAWEGVSLAIEVYLARPGAGAAGPSADAAVLARSARVRTVLPLFRKALAIVLGIVVGLIALSEFGMNIAPLLAGAGIAGIAIGFGAQSLVKDVITGIFVLLQDAVSVGDVVDVGGGNSGFVERITIRSIRLRDQSGTVIIVPFSEVSTVKNMTKDFAYALFEIGIAYREDVDYVIEVITALSEELRKDPDFDWRITAPIEILGLDRFADSAVILKVRIKTRPIQQWNVMREFNRRMKRRFDELGIEMPFPHQTIYFGVDRDGQAPPARVAIERGHEAKA